MPPSSLGDSNERIRADAQRSRAAIIGAAATLFHRDGADASLEEIARRAGVGSATLHRHFRGRQALLQAVFIDRVDHLCAEADRIGGERPAEDALWIWLREIAWHCATEKALAALVRAAGDGTTAQEHSIVLLSGAGQRLLDQAAAAGAVRPDVTIQELLFLVNAVADVCSESGADVDRMLDLTWDGARRSARRPLRGQGRRARGR